MLFPYHRGIKWLGIIILLFALIGTLVKIFKHQFHSSSPVPELISLALIFIFFSKEKIDDERIHQLKFRALTIGFLLSYFLTFAFPYIFPYTLRAHEFIASAMLFTTGIYYYAKNKL